MNNTKEIDASSTGLLENWRKILHFNSLKNQTVKIENPPNLVKIPFFPIEISPEIFNLLWSQFIDLVMNPTGVGLEIIVTSQKTIKNVYMHKVNQFGDYFEVLPILTSDLSKSFSPNEKIEQQFDRMKEWLKSKYNQELGNLRIIPDNLIQRLLEIYGQNTGKQENNILYLIAGYLDAIQEHLVLGTLVCYPPSPILSFIRGLQSLLKGITWQDLALQFGRLLPELKFTISFSFQGKYFTYQSITRRNMIQLHWIPLDITPIEKLEIIKFRKSFLKFLIKKYRCKQNLLIELSTLKETCHDVIESQFPLKMSRIKYLFQRVLNIYRNRGRCWELMPSPILYHSAIRFCLYSLGLRINPYKVSYWSIPELLELQMNQRLGLNPRICFIVADSIRKLRPDNPTHEIFGFLLEIENQNLKSLTQLPAEQLLFKEHPILSVNHASSSNRPKKNLVQQEFVAQMQEIWYILIQNYGFVNRLVWIQSNLLQRGMQDVIQGFFGRNGIALLRIIHDLYAISKPEKILIIPQDLSQKWVKKGPTFPDLKNYTVILTDPREY